MKWQDCSICTYNSVLAYYAMFVYVLKSHLHLFFTDGTMSDLLILLFVIYSIFSLGIWRTQRGRHRDNKIENKGLQKCI